jgi:hypothetical protein
MRRMTTQWSHGLLVPWLSDQQGTLRAASSLKSGLLLTRTYATKLPMPAEVIDRVHVLAPRRRAQMELFFGDRLQRPAALPLTLPISDDHDDDEDDDDSSFYPDDPDDDDKISAGSDHDCQHGQIPGVDQDIEEIENEDDNDNDNDEGLPEGGHEEDNNDNDEGLPEGGLELPEGGHEEEMDERYGARTTRYLRPRKPRDYSHLFTTDGGKQMGEDENDGLRTADDDEDCKDNRAHTTTQPKTPGVCNNTTSSRPGNAIVPSAL